MWLPGNSTFTVTDMLVAKQTNRLDAVDGTDGYWQQARYVPNRIVGSNLGAKPVLVVPAHCAAFGNASAPKPVLWFWYENGRPGPGQGPPYDGPSQPNANINQIFQGVDIRIGPGNHGAMGLRVRVQHGPL